MESEDYAFYKGLEFLIHNKVADLGYDLTFSTEIREFGVLEVRDLIPNGRNITVTEDNKMDYIRYVWVDDSGSDFLKKKFFHKIKSWFKIGKMKYLFDNFALN